MARARGNRGRPPLAIERDPQRFEIACWWAFTEMGLGKFDAARRALLATKGGPITLEDIEGVLIRATATIPLPQPFNPDDLDKGLRRLAAKAQRAKPSPWLINSAGLVQGLITFIASNNTTGIYNTATGAHGMQVGLVWWGMGMVLVAAYFIFIYRMFRGKVKLEEGGEHGY